MMEIEAEVPLCCLDRGRTGVVEAFDVCHAEHCRLAEMGFRVGEMVTMLMPGCPCAVAIGETRLMVRRELLAGVRVTPLD